MVRVYAFLIEMYYLERNINIWFVNRVLGLLLLVARNPSFYSVGPQASNIPEYPISETGTEAYET